MFVRKLKEGLKANHGVSVDKSMIYRSLLRRGFMFKRNAFVARERIEGERIKYMIDILQNYHPDQLVFVDKSAMNRLTTRRPQGWSPTSVHLNLDCLW